VKSISSRIGKYEFVGTFNEAFSCLLLHEYCRTRINSSPTHFTVRDLSQQELTLYVKLFVTIVFIKSRFGDHSIDIFD